MTRFRFRFRFRFRARIQLQWQWQMTVTDSVAVSVAVSVTVPVAEGRVRGSEQAARTRHGHLRLLTHAGVVDGRSTATVLATLDEVRAMTWRLLNPRG
jgi:predicted deacylase